MRQHVYDTNCINIHIRILEIFRKWSILKNSFFAFARLRLSDPRSGAVLNPSPSQLIGSEFERQMPNRHEHSAVVKIILYEQCHAPPSGCLHWSANFERLIFRGLDRSGSPSLVSYLKLYIRKKLVNSSFNNSFNNNISVVMLHFPSSWVFLEASFELMKSKTEASRSVAVANWRNRRSSFAFWRSSLFSTERRSSFPAFSRSSIHRSVDQTNSNQYIC